MPRKNLEIAVIDFTQAIGLLVRRVRAAAAPRAFLDRIRRHGAAVERRAGHDRRSGARGKHEAAVDGRHRRGAGGNGHGRAQAASDRRPSSEYRTDRQRRRRAEERRAMRNGRGWRRPSPSSTKRNRRPVQGRRDHPAAGAVVNRLKGNTCLSQNSTIVCALIVIDLQKGIVGIADRASDRTRSSIDPPNSRALSASGVCRSFWST